MMIIMIMILIDLYIYILLILLLILDIGDLTRFACTGIYTRSDIISGRQSCESRSCESCNREDIR